MVLYILAENEGRDDKEIFEVRQKVIDRFDGILSHYCEENEVEDHLEVVDLPVPSITSQRSDFENSAVSIAMMENADVIYIVTYGELCPFACNHSTPYSIARMFAGVKNLCTVMDYAPDDYIEWVISKIQKGENKNV